MILLKEANTADAEKEYAFMRDMPADENGCTNEFFGISREEFLRRALPSMLRRAQGLDLKAGYVPDTTYFLWDNGEIVGLFRLRHYLNDALRGGAGHIGYCIRRDLRGRGYGKKGLALALQKAKQLVPEDEIYLRVRRDNPASLRVMQANGGRIAGETEECYFVRIRKEDIPG